MGNLRKQPYSRYSKQLKLEAIRRVLEEEQSVQEVVKDLGIRHRDNVYEWIKKYKAHGPNAFDRKFDKVDYRLDENAVEKEIKQLQLEVETLKSFIKVILNNQETKYKAIESLANDYPIDCLCQALNVPVGEFLEYKQHTFNN